MQIMLYYVEQNILKVVLSTITSNLQKLLRWSIIYFDIWLYTHPVLSFPYISVRITREFLAPGAPCEINIDGKTMEKTQQELKTPSRFTFDYAAEHVYTLLLKKDCYPRFVRSEHYKGLLAAGIQPSTKKRQIFAAETNITLGNIR